MHETYLEVLITYLYNTYLDVVFEWNPGLPVVHEIH